MLRKELNSLGLAGLLAALGCMALVLATVFGAFKANPNVCRYTTTGKPDNGAYVQCQKVRYRDKGDLWSIRP